jgi:hypothetical protein
MKALKKICIFVACALVALFGMFPKVACPAEGGGIWIKHVFLLNVPFGATIDIIKLLCIWVVVVAAAAAVYFAVDAYNSVLDAYAEHDKNR